jgi:hypothetical protein
VRAMQRHKFLKEAAEGSFTAFFSPVRAHLFVAQKTHLEQTGRYFQVDQISNR